VTLLEVMPVADFSGERGWGYDGVNLYAPTRLYGSPGEFRDFVNRAHALGLGVLLDVVYNHLGPDGNYLSSFSSGYFSKRYKCEWGDALNFDGEDSGPVRDHFIGNAGYWIEEFHLDGLRLDATQQIFDASEPHIITEIARQAREKAGARSIYIVGENEPQQARLIRPASQGGHGLDSLWNDDFHHSAIVALTGRNEAYYTDYKGSPQEFISCAKRGFLYQGQRYKWQEQRRGTPALDLHPTNFVVFVENHDQVANSLWGRRVHTVSSPGAMRAMTAFLFLGPNTPMLFQGQEFAASSPFLYFADHNPELAAAVAEGRAKFLAQFPSLASAEASALLADPQLKSTFERCKLNFEERGTHAESYQFHRDLIHLRRDDPLIGQSQPGNYDGAVISTGAMVLRYFGKNRDDRLLLVNFGGDLHLDPAPEPLLAPPEGTEWELLWSSEDPKYGGGGTPPIESEENWHITSRTAALLIPKIIASHE
jgi:maltooligosyltrehalose trehalohydrolase